MQWVSDPEERKRIAAKMRGKPWSDGIDPRLVAEIASKYGFTFGFDLADALNEARWRYRNRENRSPEPFSKSELQNSRIESIQTAVLLGLWKAGNKNEYTRRLRTSLPLAPAKRSFAGKKSPGRKLDYRTMSLIRTLGAIYQDGTGKKPFITRSPGKGFRGNPFRFAEEACAAMGIKLAESHLREMEYRSKGINRRHKEQQGTIQKSKTIDNIMICWMKK